MSWLRAFIDWIAPPKRLPFIGQQPGYRLYVHSTTYQVARSHGFIWLDLVSHYTAPPDRMSAKLTPETARQIAWALLSSADVQEMADHQSG